MLNKRAETSKSVDPVSAVMVDVSADETGLAAWLKRLSPVLRSDVIFASILINLLTLGLPMLTLQVYDRIIPNSATATFTYLVLGMVTVIVLDVVLKVARSSITGHLGARYEHTIGTSALRRLFHSELERIEAEPAGAHLDRISGVDSMREFYTGPSLMALLDLPFVIIFLALIAIIGGSLVIVPVVLLLAALLVAFWLGGGLKEGITDRKTWDDRRYNFIIESLSGIHTIKGLAMERLMQRRYERLLKSGSEAGHRVALLSGLSQATGTFFNQVTLAAVAAFGALSVINGSMTIGGLAACTLLAGRTVQPVLRALGSWTRFQSVTVAEQKLKELDSLPVDRFGGDKTENVDRLELKDASFRYGDDQPYVIEDTSLSIERGQMVGIRGENGTGKTTLLAMMTGRLTPTKGSLMINGTPAADYDSRVLRSHIAFLSQRPTLLQGTVLENMTFFRPDLYLEPAIEFAARLGLDKVFARMPDGYDTLIGEAASSALPRGVVQRIAITRALARHPRVILFDEANNALDGEGEALLKETIAAIRDDVGIVMVTHRPSMLRMADRLYSLSDGRLSDLESMKAPTKMKTRPME